MTTDRHGMTVLETHECLALLRSTDVGRLAIAGADFPDIFPVNYVVDHGTVVFRTASGTKLAGLTDERRVTFEADGRTGDTAWSVVVKGYAVELRSMHDRVDALDLQVSPWHSSPKPHVVRIDPVEVTGRRFDTGVPVVVDRPRHVAIE